MTYVSLPVNDIRRLSFYLAAEEYVARHKNEAEDLFFMWQVEPSVIFGRNQVIETEVNLEYCRQHGIQTYRRKSGGGCVYADMSNIMFAYITQSDQVAMTYNHYVEMVVDVLRQLGVPAEGSGRNDIMVEGRKVAGNAFYHIPGHSIVHGTMLFDTNMQHMVGAITPSDEKLISKGVQSVRQHIALLKDYLDITIEEFKAYVRTHLCDRELLLTDEDVHSIEELEREYLSTEFIYGRNPAYTVTRRKRIEGVGELEARLEVRGGLIRRVNLLGDFFLVGDLDGRILTPLQDVPLDAKAIDAVLPDHIDDIILHLKKEDFVQLLTNS